MLTARHLTKRHGGAGGGRPHVMETPGRTRQVTEHGHVTEQQTGDARGMDTAAPTGRLQRLLAAVRLFDRGHPYVWDVTATLFWVAAALTDYASSGWRRVAQNLDVSDTQLIVLSLGFTVPLLWRRRHPMAVLAVTAPFALLNSWSGAVLQAHLVQLVPVFGLALHRPLRQLIPAFLVVVLPIVPGALRYPLAAWDAAMGPAVWGFALTALLGIAVRSRRERLASLEERARRLEVERDQQAQLATAAERARIAREMHDIIGHNLSVITGLADGGRYAAGKSPERAAQALDAIGTTSRQALGELRRLLDVLRDDDTGPPAERTPQPGLSDLDQLIDGVRAAGLPVRTRVEGRATLPPGRQLTVFRVVQEALTNTLKHAGPDTTSEISIAHGDRGAVTVTITDTGKGTPPRNPSDGRGIPGMRERTALYGGTLEAGPRPHPERGWRVRLHLPEEPPQ
ncbi:signal transduction histidine kinase [Streptomyces sp. T12]|nr:signal transduction histidine kinase [Streptomyces sp. T12]